MCRDALARDESCGGHFREEHQTPDGEAMRDDENFADVFAWEYQGDGPLSRNCIANRSSSSRFIWRRGATSERIFNDEFQTQNLAPVRADARRAAGELRGQDISPATSFLEMLDILNEQLTSAAKSRSRSTPIVAKESAGPAA